MFDEMGGRGDILGFFPHPIKIGKSKRVVEKIRHNYEIRKLVEGDVSVWVLWTIYRV